MELPRYAQPYAVISASSNVLFNGFSGVHNVQFLEEEAELLFKILPYRMFFLFRKLPQPLSKWTKGFFARRVQELFSIQSCFPFFLTIVFYPLVHVLSKRVRHSVIDNVLKTGGQVNFKRFMLWKLIKQFIGECGGAMNCLINFQSIKRLKFTDRKSTRLNSSHTVISYAVFCLKKKKKKNKVDRQLISNRGPLHSKFGQVGVKLILNAFNMNASSERACEVPVLSGTVCMTEVAT